MQLGLHCWELHTILFRMHVFWDVMLCQWLNGSQHFKGWNTRKVGISVQCTWTILDPLCSPYIHVLGSPALWTKCSILLTEMSLKSPGFIQWRPRYPNLIWPKPHSHKDASQMPVCISQHSGLCTSPSLNSCPFKLHCPVSSPVTIFSSFLLKLSNSPAHSAEGLLRKPLACLCPWMACHCYVCFLFTYPVITSLPIMVHMPTAGSGPTSGHEEPCLTSWSAKEFERLYCLQLPLKMKATQPFETSGSLIQQHGIISQRNWIFSITTVRTSNLAWCC
jgi:hypothetical protein